MRLEPDNFWSRFVEQRPGAARRLTGTLDELREAGIEPGIFEELACGRPQDEALAALYASYVAELDDKKEKCWVDEAGLILEAVDRIDGLVDAYRQVLVHGAYEWLGVHLDLLRSLARSNAMTLLMPIAPGRRVTGYAEAYARSQLLEDRESLEPRETADDPGRPPRVACVFARPRDRPRRSDSPWTRR
jgi:hypothetical protein